MSTERKQALWADVSAAAGEDRAYSCLAQAELIGDRLLPKTYWAWDKLRSPGMRAILAIHGLQLVEPAPAHRAAPRVEYGPRRRR